MIQFTIYGKPIAKPRMTRQDKWKKRQCVVDYRAWADCARLVAGKLPPAKSILVLSWKAYFEPPKSWSKKKRKAMLGKLHRQKPDRDNLDKSVLDALYPKGDAAIPGGVIKKYWGEPARLEVTIELDHS